MGNSSQKISLTVLEDRIVLVEYKDEDIYLKDVIFLYDELEKIGNGKKIGILNVFTKVINSRDDVMEYTNKDPRPQKILFASATLMESIGMRLVMMLFMKFYNQVIHRKVFSSRDNAMQWLREMRDK